MADAITDRTLSRATDEIQQGRVQILDQMQWLKQPEAALDSTADQCTAAAL